MLAAGNVGAGAFWGILAVFAGLCFGGAVTSSDAYKLQIEREREELRVIKATNRAIAEL
jgi:hypothetical protein